MGTNEKGAYFILWIHRRNFPQAFGFGEEEKRKKMKVNARMDRESQNQDDEEIPGSGQGMYGYILMQALVGEQLSAVGFQQRGP